MTAFVVTKHNFVESLKLVKNRCKRELQAAADHQMLKDLMVAIDALDLIEREIKEHKQRPIGQRSGQFTRYVIDEDDAVAMDADLKHMVVQLELVYKDLI